MAKSSNPDSATSGWFVNTTDNLFLGNPSNSGGFTVIGAVRKGMEVVDAVAGLPFGPFDIDLVPVKDPLLHPLFETLPMQDYTQEDFNLDVMPDENNLIIQNDIFVVSSVMLLDLEIVSNNNEALVEVTIKENDLILDFKDGLTGSASITVRGTDPQGNDVDDTFTVTVTEEFFDEGFEEGFNGDYALENDAAVVDDGSGTGNQVAQLTENSDAAFARDFDLPPDVRFIELDYRFTNVGDGDALVVNVITEAGTVEVFREVGTDFTDGATFVTTGPIDILQFANKQVTIEVRLDSANAINAQVQVDDLKLLAVGLFTVRIGDDEARSVSFTDTDLTVGTILLKTGIAEVKFEGDDLERIITGKGVVVTGANVRLSSIELIGTTAKSTL